MKHFLHPNEWHVNFVYTGLSFSHLLACESKCIQHLIIFHKSFTIFIIYYKEMGPTESKIIDFQIYAGNLDMRFGLMAVLVNLKRFSSLNRDFGAYTHIKFEKTNNFLFNFFKYLSSYVELEFQLWAHSQNWPPKELERFRSWK